MMLESLSAAIAASLGTVLRSEPAARVHGGCINECFRWDSDAGPLFVKVAAAEGFAMLDAEAAGLGELQRSGAVRVPRVLGVGSTQSASWLALEWIEMAPGTSRAAAHLGEQLARLHGCTWNAFGWSRDNTIGSTVQTNLSCADWPDFWRDQRLRPQLRLAAEHGFSGELQRRGELLLAGLGGFFATYRPRPALLHGDLWGGNWAQERDAMPVIFDPAVYYGDREADLAMTRLFGGFPPEFRAAYELAWPTDPGAAARESLYNLYHVLNHLNLFGASYRQQAQQMIDALLAQLGR